MNGTVASDRKVNYLVDLAAQRTPRVTEDAIRTWAQTVHWSVVSAKITALLAMPVVTAKPAVVPTPDVPAGRYAVDGEDGALKFYRVDRPTEGRWAGRTFVNVQASDELHPIRGRAAANAILAKIAVDPRTAMVRYGHELGHCGYCGRTLTDPVSRERGIGPVCASKLGY